MGGEVLGPIKAQ
jgi:hypothetical protein